MAISTYAELQTAVANWHGSRSDTFFTARVPEFIAICEGWIAHGLRVGDMVVPPLRVRAMEQSTDLTINAQTVALPTRFLQARRIYLDGNPKGRLRFYGPSAFWEKFSSGAGGRPTGFTTEGDNFVFGPGPDITYTGKALFYQKFAVFSSSSDTNWLLTNNPAAYLYGSLYASTTLGQKHPMAMEWLAGFAGTIRALNDADQADRFSGGPLEMSSDTWNP